MSWPESGYDTPPHRVDQYNTPPALIAITLAILVVCFVAFSFLYLCKFCLVSVVHTWAFERTASDSLVRLSTNNNNRPPSRAGVDPSLLQMFPSFEYSFVKELYMKNKKKNHFLECAICLLEFDDNSMLRLLTVCCHVFHQECIDLWLGSHKTCPVCRTDLNSPSSYTRRIKHDGEYNSSSSHSHSYSYSYRHNHLHDDADQGDHRCEEEQQEEGEGGVLGGDYICIDIREGQELADAEGDGVGVGGESAREHGHCDQAGVNVQLQQQQQQQAEHTRSHSTGHSIVMNREEEKQAEEKEDDDDKYTLRLPEQVITRARRGGGHNFSKSCTSYQEMQSNCGFIESLSAEPCSNSLTFAQKT